MENRERGTAAAHVRKMKNRTCFGNEVEIAESEAIFGLGQRRVGGGSGGGRSFSGDGGFELLILNGGGRRYGLEVDEVEFSEIERLHGRQWRHHHRL